MAPQSYYLGGKVRASDFNGFADDINEIVGLGAGDSGYGQDQLMVSYVTTGSKVRAADWDSLLTSIKFAAQHQGTNISIPTSTSHPDWPHPRKMIELLPDLENTIINVRSNKFNADPSVMTLDVNKISSSVTYTSPNSDWAGTNYEFSVNFSDDDARRNFFNAGGEVRTTSSFLPTSTDSQSESWENFLTDIDTVIIGVNTTTAGIGSQGIGYNQLTNTYQTIYEKANSATDYSDNKLVVKAKLQNNSIHIKLSFEDAHTNTFFDSVIGTLSVTVDQLRADDNDSSGNGVVSPTPTYSHISEL